MTTAVDGSDGALSVRGVTVRFGGVTALDDVSLEVAPGEVLGVIGPNGAGKTTLFNVVCGFVRPQQGTIRWHGELVGRVRTNLLTRRGIARTLQGVGLFPGLSVMENVLVGAQRFRRAGFTSALLALPRSRRDEHALRERARAALAQVGCDEVADRMPDSLPYATQKRVALARALVGEPELLLLDEPAGGLDAEELARLGALVRGLRESMAVMLVEHHMDFVSSVCDRLVALDFGRVVSAGDPEVVRRDPRVLEAYLGDEAAPAGGREPVAPRERARAGEGGVAADDGSEGRGGDAVG
jgi:branched-chain amino acid transport system ATP-binding protein